MSDTQLPSTRARFQLAYVLRVTAYTRRVAPNTAVS